MKKCKFCGGCCTKSIIEINGLDVLREPKLQTYVKKFTDPEEVLVLPSPCPFLKRRLTLCRIYPTRPNVCVAFDVGGEQCRRWRRQ